MNRSRASISTASTAPSLRAFCRTASSASCEPSPATMSDSPRFSVIATTWWPWSMNCFSRTEVSSPPEYASTIFTGLLLSTHVFETLFDHGRLFGGFDDHQDGGVAADRAEDLRQVRAVDRGREHHRRPRMRAQHDLVHRRARLDHHLGDDAVQPRGKCRPDARLDVLEGAAAAALERNLEQPELLDVARDRRLRDVVPLLLEHHGQLVLRVHRPRRDQ